jgi:hypothetical protein
MERSSVTDKTREPHKASYQKSRAGGDTSADAVDSITFKLQMSPVEGRRFLTAALDTLRLGRNSDDLYSNMQAFNQTFEHVIRRAPSSLDI